MPTIEHFSTNAPDADPAEYNSSFTYQRNPDPLYLDTDDNDLDFLLATATPGFRNFTRNLLDVSELDNEIVFNFDSDAGTVEKRLGGSYFDLYNQNPGVVPPNLGPGNRSGNTQVIPPSPQGGNVGIHWNHLQDHDVMGNGVQGILSLKEPVKDIEIETYVYVGPALKDEPLVIPNENDPSSETHIWEGGSFVIARGRPDTHPIGHNRYAFYSFGNGDTGIRLHYRNNVTRGSNYTVYFDQQVNGVRTIFEQFEVENPGWYRVLLSVRGDQTMAIFGGEFGNYTAADGTFENGKRLPATPNTYYTTTITRPGNVGYNYHAFLALNNAGKKKFRPATFDKLTYRKPTVIPSASVDDWKIY